MKTQTISWELGDLERQFIRERVERLLAPEAVIALAETIYRLGGGSPVSALAEATHYLARGGVQSCLEDCMRWGAVQQEKRCRLILAAIAGN